MKYIPWLLLSLVLITQTCLAQHSKHRVIISTDIGGTDPDDFQSMVHLLLYADALDIEGLISSPFGEGTKQDILHVIDLYQQDYPNLKRHSDDYPSPEQLRAITKQGEKKSAPYQGYRRSTEGSRWIVERARADDPRPLYVLVWGGIEDLAQALHDAPDILPKLRVHYIGGPNKKWGPDAYQYIAEQHPKLWIIESNATYRGWFVGGVQSDDWGNESFVSEHIAQQGALGKFFNTQLGGVIKMGDTPTVAWLLNGDPESPAAGGWGGQYVRAWTRPTIAMNRLTNKDDQIEEFGVLELTLAAGDNLPTHPEAFMDVENQSLIGHFDNGYVHFRFTPKAAKVFNYSIRSNVASLNNQSGAITAVPTSPAKAMQPNSKWPNWWVDNPDPRWAEGPHIGAKTVSQWRQAFLSDFAKRMQRIQHAP
ncbi:MAG: DUF1593 domain-containing protein [Paraglaciecola sp.]|uniref:DUF1593 domain-containing protein n=1 Tax=Paraglaciecola sp. TaxID=1920173 RepID=UPI0032988A56